MRTIARTARTISARNLGERLALDGPDDEFKELGDTLDDLFARLQAAFDSQRHFVANASHELRTPLTVERSLLQIALADPNPTIESLLTTCQNALLNSEQQQHLIDGLLTLASSEGGLDNREPCDLAPITEHVLLTPRDRRSTVLGSRSTRPCNPHRSRETRACSNGSSATSSRTPSTTTPPADTSRSPPEPATSTPS